MLGKITVISLKKTDNLSSTLKTIFVHFIIASYIHCYVGRGHMEPKVYILLQFRIFMTHFEFYFICTIYVYQN